MSWVYESHYLRAVDPARPRAAWIRHTSYQRPGEAATGALWCTLWDAEAMQDLFFDGRKEWSGVALAAADGVSQEELRRISDDYKKVAGFALQSVK